jgi:hypothetical protein
MKTRSLLLFTILAVTLSLFGAAQAGSSLAPQANSLTLVSPAGCPSSGCAPGQRLNFKAVFDLGTYDTSANPNVQFCIYAPNDWVDTSSLAYDANGGTSNAAYNAGKTDNCPAPTPSGYILVGGATATLTTAGVTSDSLGFALRLSHAAPANSGTLEVMALTQQTGATWTQASPAASFNMTIAAISQTAYVANDATSCGSYSPCYVNSAADLADGLGTGLKDAIDAVNANAMVDILGTYTAKSHAVTLNKALTLQGLNNATLSSTATQCSEALLNVTAGAIIQNLNINGGACSNQKRDLVQVNSPDPVVILYNDLVGGQNGIHVLDNSGNVQLRYNDIRGNAAYGLLRDTNDAAKVASPGKIFAVANNIFGNQGGQQAECNNLGQVDHNFWGFGVTTTDAVHQCTAAAGKILGAPARLKSNQPGVDVQRVTVGSAKTGAFNNQISFQHPSGASDFDVYVVNHGYGSNDNIPFLGHGTSFITPCSNFWDIFLAENADTSSIPSLDVFVRYDLTSTCLSTIQSTSYCGQTADPSLYPLYWYDPANTVTNSWDTTGQSPDGPGAGGASGQTTSCVSGTPEIQVSIDNSGRPNLSTDLSFMPMVVGIPVSLQSFTASAGIAEVLIRWATVAEPNISGYYVIRSVSANGSYSRTSNFIQAKGNASIGGVYSYTDTDLENGINYYYKLEIIDTNGQTIGFYGPVQALTATSTPTITPTPTRTLTPTPTMTRTPSHSPTSTRTWTPYPTSTSYYYYYYYTSTPIRRTATSYYYSFPTSTRTRTPTPGGSRTPGTLSPYESLLLSRTPQPTGAFGTQLSPTISPAAGTEAAILPVSLTGTPAPSSTPVKPIKTDSKRVAFLISLLSGGALGLIVLVLSVWYLIRYRGFTF